MKKNGKSFAAEHLRLLFERLAGADKAFSRSGLEALFAPLANAFGLEGFGEVQKPDPPFLLPRPDMTIRADRGPIHVLIEGENLLALSFLRAGCGEGSIDAIYIDPPYNTGNTGFAYRDSFPDGEWLAMMNARLRLGRMLLKDDGVLFVSIDGKFLCECKLMLDGLFGHPPLSIICVEVSKTMGMRIKSAKNGNIAKNHEYVLVYAKNPEYALKDRRALYDGAEIYDNHYKWFMEDDLKPRPLVDVINDDPFLSGLFEKHNVPAKLGEIGKLMSISPDFRDWIYKNAEHIYQTMDFRPRLPEKTLLELREKPAARYGGYLLRLTSGGRAEQYAPLSWSLFENDDYNPSFGRATIRGSLWKGFYSDMMNVGKEGGVPFKNAKKPKRLIRQLLKWANRPKGIVLDFFAGSGTALHSVLELNGEDDGSRRCILCTSNELGKDAIIRAGKAGASGMDRKKYGICESVTWPRLRAVITGNAPNGARLPAFFPENSLLSYEIADADASGAISAAEFREIFFRDFRGKQGFHPD